MALSWSPVSREHVERKFRLETPAENTSMEMLPLTTGRFKKQLKGVGKGTCSETPLYFEHVLKPQGVATAHYLHYGSILKTPNNISLLLCYKISEGMERNPSSKELTTLPAQGSEFTNALKAGLNDALQLDALRDFGATQPSSWFARDLNEKQELKLCGGNLGTAKMQKYKPQGLFQVKGYAPL
ncbi:hypothetical protein Anapl_17306 [Anas platyrhynchos]|uniref:Uncharacterized protein n=1 Tax=Anas platyrhynchos TaxID=8839 RepID=R0JRH3_ANAPL|nr:hypothetical protein Anapl_17306 [Anas platyrhynchos]